MLASRFTTAQHVTADEAGKSPVVRLCRWVGEPLGNGVTKQVRKRSVTTVNVYMTGSFPNVFPQ